VGPTWNGQQRSSFQTRLRLVPPETAESRTFDLNETADSRNESLHTY
jgi:hypothetical protein